MKNKKIDDLLLENGLITEEQLMDAISKQSITRKKISEILIDEGVIEEVDFINVLQKQLGLQAVDSTNIYIDKNAIKSLPYVLAKKHITVPLHYDSKGSLVVAINDPLDLIALDNLKLVTKRNIIPQIATKKEIIGLIERFYNTDDAEKAVEEFNRVQSNIQVQEQEEQDEISNAPVVRIVNNIIETGVRAGASDIHIEPYEERIRVRMRVDGVLVEMMELDIRTHNAIVSRIKILGDLNIAERRLPQDGAFLLKVDNREIDFRVSIIPTIHGEKVVIRILDKGQFQLDIDELGFTAHEINVVKNFISSPHGIILVTGPTGSGKSTTLYTLLRELNKIEDNIITIEEPVELKLEGISQVQVNNKTGLTFLKGLRSILRQDPDIIMIGEIRDAETAQIAIRASITGHLVLSTLHTNDAIATIIRLVEMGIEPFLASSSIIGIISQRLIRKLCPRCKTPYEASEADKRLLGFSPEEKLKIYKANGCVSCNQSGYKNRIGVHEIVKVDKDLREAIGSEKSYDELTELALKSGMVTLFENTKKLILEGVTTVEEALDIAFIREV